jgi:hypothetical protein
MHEPCVHEYNALEIAARHQYFPKCLTKEIESFAIEIQDLINWLSLLAKKDFLVSYQP